MADVKPRRDRRAQRAEATRQRIIETAGRFLHPDFALVLVHPAPDRVDRTDLLHTLEEYDIKDWNVQQFNWDVRGDMATNLQLVEQSAVVRGADRSGPFVLSDIWLREPAGWQLWRRHSTPLEAGAWPRA